MHVLYDGRIYLTQAAGGINRYFQNVIDRLHPDDRITMTLPVLPRVNFPSHANLRTIVARQGRGEQLTRPLQLRRAVRGLDHDILHPTYYRLLDHSSMRRSRVPVVLTVHDMVQERFREQLDPRGIRREIKRRAIRAADAIICVSRSTRDELLDIHPWIDEGRVQVVHHATELGPNSPRDTSLVPDAPYLFHVGSRFWYKDFDLVLEALHELEREHPQLLLVVAGPAFSNEEQARIAELGLGHLVRHAGLVTDAQLAALYEGARALVYASRYEGFGIPPLEAMVCGTIVVAANATSIPEVVQDAGILFEPGDAAALTDALRRALGDDALRAKLLERGRERAASFSWERTAAQTRAVYESLL